MHLLSTCMAPTQHLYDTHMALTQELYSIYIAPAEIFCGIFQGVPCHLHCLGWANSAGTSDSIYIILRWGLYYFGMAPVYNTYKATYLQVRYMFCISVIGATQVLQVPSTYEISLGFENLPKSQLNQMKTHVRENGNSEEIWKETAIFKESGLFNHF